MPDLGMFYLANPQHPVRYKREFERVTEISLFDVWEDVPSKAYVHFTGGYNGHDISSPIKLYQRKNGSYYLQFEGHRYDVDITVGNCPQFIGHDGKNEILREKGFYKQN